LKYIALKQPQLAFPGVNVASFQLGKNDSSLSRTENIRSLEYMHTTQVAPSIDHPVVFTVGVVTNEGRV